MVFEKLRGMARDEYDDDTENNEYVEVGVMEAGGMPGSEKMTGRVGIKIDKLNDFNDTERVLRFIREGKLVFLKIKALKEKDMGELKRSVERLRKTVAANNGDIVGVEQDWLILTPEYIGVHRD